MIFLHIQRAVWIHEHILLEYLKDSNKHTISLESGAQAVLDMMLVQLHMLVAGVAQPKPVPRARG
jgi:hypothetical protein